MEITPSVTVYWKIEINGEYKYGCTHPGNVTKTNKDLVTIMKEEYNMALAEEMINEPMAEDIEELIE